jgi:hypothetical protein
VLLKEIRAICAEPPVFVPGDVEAEGANTCWLGASPHERLGLSVGEVTAAFVETAELLRARVRETGYRGTATFYVWHDQQAGQLRCSTASRLPADLPFGGGYFPTHDLGTIVTEFLNDGEPGFVRFADLRPADDGVEPTLRPYPVWTYDVSAASAG